MLSINVSAGDTHVRSVVTAVTTPTLVVMS